jgi:hypothetical protein
MQSQFGLAVVLPVLPPQLLLVLVVFALPAMALVDGASAKTSPPNAITPKKFSSRRIRAPPP